MLNSNIDYVLSQESLKGIPFQKYENNFTFIVDGRRYQTNRLVADILSPNVRQLHFTDSSSDEYTITTRSNQTKESYETDYFQDFLSLISYQNCHLDLNRQKAYSEYFYQLGNINEYVRILQDPSQGIISNNVLDRLSSIIISETQSGKTINSDSKQITEIISFIASHFEEMNKEQLKKIDIDMLSEIFCNENLILNNEDSLLEFILSLYHEDNSYSILFEYVLFNNVGCEALEKFIDEVSFNDMNLSIWRSICYRLVKSRAPKINEKRYNSNPKFDVIVKNHIKGKEFDGILNYLTKETGGNIHDNKTIEITSNSIYENHHPKNLVDYEQNNFYESLINTNAIVCFDLKNKRVQLTSYSIRYLPSVNNMKNWAVEVSNDKVSWEIVDEHQNESALSTSNAIRTFDVKKTESFYRYVRIRQLMSSNGWGSFIDIGKYEIYGKLMPNSK